MSSRFIANWAALRGCLIIVMCAVSVGALAGESTTTASIEAADVEPTAAVSPSGNPNSFSRKGVRVDFSATLADAEESARTRLYEGDFVDVTFRVSGEVDGAPVRGVFPGVWLDLDKAWSGRGVDSMECKQRVGIYLQGTVGMRPMVDLNSYFILVMTQSPVISVIDPAVGITGVTNLYDQINLASTPADWVKTSDERRLFATLPETGQVAVVDLQTFDVAENLDVGKNPIRIALQPDEKYLWVGNNAPGDQVGGVSVIDTGSLKPVVEIPTGKGHHEIAFSADNRYAFVSNRNDGTVSIIDIQTLQKIKDVEIGGVPISLGYSPLSQALFVADGKSGVISVLRGDYQQVAARVLTKPGLGPLRVTEDGRWVLVVNTAEDLLYVIDAATNQLKHSIPVGEEPYQIGFSREFAYVRALATERVSMVYLPDLKKEATPPVVGFPAGSKAPKRAGSVSIADGMTQAAQEAAVLVVSPADATVYYYMEGMNAPMGAFRNYGQRPRAVTIADRSLKEKAPGIYTGKVKLPAAGIYDVAFLMETPQLLHCFSLEVEPDPNAIAVTGPLEVEYLDRQYVVPAGETHKLRFQLKDPASGELRRNLADVRVRYYRAPNFGRKEVSAAEVEPGIYEAAIQVTRVGAYYAYIGVPSQELKFGDIPFITLRATQQQQVTTEAKVSAHVPADGSDGLDAAQAH